jgi:hypothetical protein
VRDPDATVTCRFWGTGVSVYVRFSPDAGTARFIIDSDTFANPAEDAIAGQLFLTYRVSDAFELPVLLATGLSEGQHTVTIGVEGDGELVVGGFLVERERPMIWPVAVLMAAGLVALFLGFRNLAMLSAEHVGLIAPRTDDPQQTPLPTLPNWKPVPRFNRGR